MLVFAPCGSGKSYFIKKYKGAYTILDGDVLLQELGVKNRNYYWYDDARSAERSKITETLEKAVSDGKIVLYSGNPTILVPNLIIHPDAHLRWEQVQSREGFVPTEDQFDREEDAYFDASTSGITTLSSFGYLLKYLDSLPSED